jgi:hypothetical protein
MADESRSGAVWKVSAAVLGLVAIGASICSYTQYADVQTLTSRLAVAQADAQQAKSANDALQSQLSTLQSQLANQARPDLPVRLGLRNALLGGGKVAVLQNESNSALEIIVEAQSPVTGAHFKRAYVMNPRAILQIGPQQGWPFAPGQSITVSNPKFRPVTRTVS